ncbi:YeeE/YedE family protein [Stutzerimonas stutzeri]|uniref:YeeE/YedE family protein n=1 Tax=Stutzerimonas stutzeri TaxID=316 RepID=A0A6I6LLX8_STUST|nr:YeeE/YedE family protein [Stutzerimonas stutzeri]QGZ31859.1 YeeE/YedE family protein [Stutzerimonas stutzeri]
MNIDWSNFTPWSSLAGGALIGLAVGIFVVANGRIAGISGLLAGILRPAGDGWLEKGLFLLGLALAPLLWLLSGDWPQVEFQTGPLGILLAGLLVGLGTRYGSGCTSGHGVCGLSRLSLRSLAATLCFMASGFATVYLMRHGLGR